MIFVSFCQCFQENLSEIGSEDSDQVQCFVRPDLAPNCLQMLLVATLAGKDLTQCYISNLYLQ